MQFRTEPTHQWQSLELGYETAAYDEHSEPPNVQEIKLTREGLTVHQWAAEWRRSVAKEDPDQPESGWKLEFPLETIKEIFFQQRDILFWRENAPAEAVWSITSVSNSPGNQQATTSAGYRKPSKIEQNTMALNTWAQANPDRLEEVTSLTEVEWRLLPKSPPERQNRPVKLPISRTPPRKRSLDIQFERPAKRECKTLEEKEANVQRLLNELANAQAKQKELENELRNIQSKVTSEIRNVTAWLDAWLEGKKKYGAALKAEKNPNDNAEEEEQPEEKKR
ncbi:MAG: hypothetical protein Q9209_007198 [Squamulea sp. 1 TL-2023]